jgi:hypothetical protein
MDTVSVPESFRARRRWSDYHRLRKLARRKRRATDRLRFNELSLRYWTYRAKFEPAWGFLWGEPIPAARKGKKK